MPFPSYLWRYTRFWHGGCLLHYLFLVFYFLWPRSFLPFGLSLFMIHIDISRDFDRIRFLDGYTLLRYIKTIFITIYWFCILNVDAKYFFSINSKLLNAHLHFSVDVSGHSVIYGFYVVKFLLESLKKLIVVEI